MTSRSLDTVNAEHIDCQVREVFVVVYSLQLVLFVVPVTHFDNTDWRSLRQYTQLKGCEIPAKGYFTSDLAAFDLLAPIPFRST